MLLVKSKELKNSNNKMPSSSCLTGLFTVIASVLISPAYAQEQSMNIMSGSSIMSVFLSLLVVIAIIFALAYIVRRFNVAQAGQGQMRVVASMMAGSKEKVMVIEVGEEQHLLGITANNISHLATLKAPLSNSANRRCVETEKSPKTNQSVPASDNHLRSAKHGSVVNHAGDLQQNFQQKLVAAMATNISNVIDKASKSMPGKTSLGNNTLSLSNAKTNILTSGDDTTTDIENGCESGALKSKHNA